MLTIADSFGRDVDYGGDAFCGRCCSRLPARLQKFNVSANWIWRMEAAVPLIVPKFAMGAGPDPPPQLALGFPNSTWFGALNISARNSRFFPSAIWKYFMTETSW